jgi:DNA-binding transcriptional regulator YiaG
LIKREQPVEPFEQITLVRFRQWELARSFPRPLMVTALERFLADQEKVPPSSMKRSIAPVIERLKAWRERNNISQAQAVNLLQLAGLPARLKTLQAWESGRNSPQAITAAAIERFLEEQGRS